MSWQLASAEVVATGVAVKLVSATSARRRRRNERGIGALELPAASRLVADRRENMGDCLAADGRRGSAETSRSLVELSAVADSSVLGTPDSAVSLDDTAATSDRPDLRIRV